MDKHDLHDATSFAMRTPLSRARGLGSAKSGTGHFWQERVTSLALIPLTLLFLIVVLPLIGTDHGTAVRTIARPLIALPLIALSALTAWHMKLGMQVIIEDYVHHEGWKLALLLLNGFFCWALGLIAVFILAMLSFFYHMTYVMY